MPAYQVFSVTHPQGEEVHCHQGTCSSIFYVFVLCDTLLCQGADWAYATQEGTGVIYRKESPNHKFRGKEGDPVNHFPPHLLGD